MRLCATVYRARECRLGEWEAPATVAVIKCHAGHVPTANAWELGDPQGTVGKLSASCFEVTGSATKLQGSPSFERAFELVRGHAATTYRGR